MGSSCLAWATNLPAAGTRSDDSTLTPDVSNLQEEDSCQKFRGGHCAEAFFRVGFDVPERRGQSLSWMDTKPSEVDLDWTLPLRFRQAEVPAGGLEADSGVGAIVSAGYEHERFLGR